MHYIKDFMEGEQVSGVWLVKEIRTGETRTGKPYETVTLVDKTGRIDGKIWDLNNPGICEFDVMDFIDLVGDIRVFNNSLQMNIRSARKAGEGDYIPSDYIATSDRDVDDMYGDILAIIRQVEHPMLRTLLERFFIEDKTFVTAFKGHSAAKTVHHSYAGGLLEHTLHVAQFCEYLAEHYPLLNKDLLITAALCHDIGKIHELSDFPLNDYTDAGQLLGHIVMGTEMVTDKIRTIDGFPEKLANQLKHCILAHHGEYEYGSPKTPALMEALALNLADNADAKLECFMEIMLNAQVDADGWSPYDRFFASKLRKTEV